MWDWNDLAYHIAWTLKLRKLMPRLLKWAFKRVIGKFLRIIKLLVSYWLVSLDLFELLWRSILFRRQWMVRCDDWFNITFNQVLIEPSVFFFSSSSLGIRRLNCNMIVGRSGHRDVSWLDRPGWHLIEFLSRALCSAADQLAQNTTRAEGGGGSRRRLDRLFFSRGGDIRVILIEALTTDAH